MEDGQEQDAAPLVICAMDCGKVCYCEYRAYAKEIMLLHSVEGGYGYDAEGKRLHNIADTVHAIQQVPWYLAGKGEEQHRGETPITVAWVGVALRHQEGEHRKGNLPETAHGLVISVSCGTKKTSRGKPPSRGWR